MANNWSEADLAELSMYIAIGKFRHPSGAWFESPDQSATTTPNLATTIASMEKAGYAVGKPVKAVPSSKPFHTEWHLPITRGRNTCTMAFLVPEDVA